jgi:hypothetical protein
LDEFRRGIREILHDIEVNDALDDLERALGWTVACEDLEYGQRTLFGFFTDPVEAAAYANRLQKSLREPGEGELGWSCTPHPILPSDP